MIEIYAGAGARKRIEEQGFNADLFGTLLGASGGPKWLMLYGLDCYLFGEFFKARRQPLNLLGSSAGAFRAACFACDDSIDALRTMAALYIDTTYSTLASPAEITGKVRSMLAAIFPHDSVAQVLDNPIFKLHISVARCHGAAASTNRLLQLVGMATASRRNRRDRASLTTQFERYLFRQRDSDLSFNDPYGLPTTQVDLNRDNLIDAVLASGSLPVIMQGIVDIAGCTPGIYRDGGLVDYQFDLQLADDRLVLYPHYSRSLKPGWFDKNLNRLASAKNHDKTVLICPTPEFVASLPYQRIPDRSDFNKMKDDQRIAYWRNVQGQTSHMGDALSAFVARQRLDEIRDIAELVAA